MTRNDPLALSAGASRIASSGVSKAAEARIMAAYARRKHLVPADRYSYFDRGSLLLVQSRERHALQLLAEQGCRPLDRKKIVEVGCGTGSWLRDFIRWGARPENLAGVDLLPDSLAEARSWHRLLGGQRLIMGRYVRGTRATRGAGGAGGG